MDMGHPGTSIGGEALQFRTTCWSSILQAREGDRENLGMLIRTYWKPVYAYIRNGWGKSNEDAKDLTQAFFTGRIGRPFLADVGPGKGRFRSFLRACLKNFLSNEEKRRQALKREGRLPPLSLNALEHEIPGSLDPVDA